MKNKIFFLLAMLMLAAGVVQAQITTSGIAGKVTSESDAVIGATITAKHVPSGTVYRAVTNHDGRFSIQGMRVGGPYQVEVSYIAYETKVFKDINLRLGETQDLSCDMKESSELLQEVVVTARSGLDATKTGAAQSFSAQMINDMPSITHSVSDVARMNPLVSVHSSGAMSFAGANNRYNSFMIDGAFNNDNFGLSSTGMNGGQTSTQPVSMETIEQLQVSIAPFDVRQSGFTGGSVNAITKSGTNQFHGSVYGNWYNAKLIGRHYKMSDGNYSQPYSDDEHEWQYGFTLGGPIVKDKLFFFANYERNDLSYPVPDASKVDRAKADEILNDIKELAALQGIDYRTSFNHKDVYRKSDKAGIKLDWNINDANKLTLRWSLVDAKRLAGNGGISSLYTDDHQYDFTSNTNTFVAELQSKLSQTLSNELRGTYVRVRDKRTSGAAFPSITVNNVGDGSISLGNEYNSMANSLDQDIYTIEDNLTLLAGNHTFTLGTHNEFYTFDNLFIADLYGAYTFKNYDDFISAYNGIKEGNDIGQLINRYYYNHANTDVTGDPRWSAHFTAGQLGFYLQDKWDATNRLQLTLGARVDIPLFLDTPSANVPFNSYASSKGWNFQTNRRLKSTPMVSPRLGFRWNAKGNSDIVVRGGVGVFTGRIPYVWLSNSFTDTGIQIKKYSSSGGAKGLQLLLDPNNQTPNEELLKSSGSQDISVFEKDFKFAQSLRANLGVDVRALGIDWTFEAVYSKTLNDVYYRNLAYAPTGKLMNEIYPELSWETRPMMERVTLGQPYNNIYALYNTSRGYTYNLSVKAEKHFPFGFDLNASYTFTKSKAVSSVTSSQAQANWRNNHTHKNPNEPELTNSAFNIPHQIKASAFYHVNYGRANRFKTTVGIIYTGSSGSPYSLYVSGTDMNGDGYSGNELMYIPTDEQVNQMTFVDANGIDAETQRANFKQWLGSQRYVKDHRGEYYERYADNMPFESHFDFHFAEEIKVVKDHRLEISFDIMNVANLLNKDWGRSYGSSSYVSVYKSPLNYEGSGKFSYTKTPDYDIFDVVDLYSRWRGQISLKYTF